MDTNNMDYFSLDNLSNLGGIEEHLSFAEGLIERYGKETGQYEQFRRMLGGIRAKQNDKKLNISVIGEFSTGKSTFINALLQKQLLVSSILQGTTVASTILTYHSEYCLDVKKIGASKGQRIWFDDYESMKDKLEEITTNPDVAKDLDFVRVRMPADFLKKDIRIIDTPGTNVTEAWHEDVTIRTLKNMSDLSIILISAEHPAPETLLHFIEKNLSSILPQCIFVVTRLDMIKPRERKQVLGFIKMKLEEELELENVVVLPYVSISVLGMEEAVKEGCPLLEESLETEKILLEQTAKQRTVAQTKKLLQLLQNIYGALDYHMKGLTKSYEQRLADLERTKHTDLKSFIKRQVQERTRDFDAKIEDHQEKIISDLEDMAKTAKSNVLGKLDDLENIDKMKNYLTGSSLKADCTEEGNNMINRAQMISTQAELLFESEMYRFQKEFKNLYQKLKILEIHVELEKKRPECNISNISADFSATASYISSELSKENWAFGGGAAAGAVLGTALFPGIGTVVGGFIGAVVGASSSDKNDEVRRKCKEKLDAPLTSYFHSIQSQSERSVENYLKSIKQMMAGQMERYLNTYLGEVNRRIGIEKSERDKVVKKADNIKQEIYQLDIHKKQLESFYSQLDKLNRKNDSI